MKQQEMSVYLIARPTITGETGEWLREIGAGDWLNDELLSGAYDELSDVELVSTLAGRRCYRSFGVGLNPNVTKVRSDAHAYLQNIIDVGHGSVLEHGMFTFAFEGISRVVTHELVRHRHAAVSQESLRYVRLTDIPFRHPDFVQNNDVLREEADELLERLEQFQLKLAEVEGLDEEGVDFHRKKEVTSGMRRYAPIGLLTGMVWSANVRALRHLVEVRTSVGAEAEIRELFTKVGEIMRDECPALFADFTVNDAGEWIPKRSKV